VDGNDPPLPVDYGVGYTIGDIKATYFTTGAGGQVVASLNFYLGILSYPPGWNSNYRVINLFGHMPGGATYCGSLPAGLDWSLTMSNAKMLGPVSMHSATFWEFNVPGGFFPSRNTEGGYAETSQCLDNRFAIFIKVTQDLLVGPAYNFGVEMHYPVD